MAYKLMRTRMACAPVETPSGTHRLYAYDAWRPRNPETDGDAVATVFNSNFKEEWTRCTMAEVQSLLEMAFPEFCHHVERMLPDGATVIGSMVWLPVDLESETVYIQ
jgi:hypothetical protein